MQQYIFVKKSSSIQLGHIYEHAISIGLVDLLSSKKMYRYVDYDFIAKTYHGGLIYIELLAYTKAAKVTIKTLNYLDLNENYLQVAVEQISAELTTKIEINYYKDLIDSIERLHSQKWQTLDNFTLIDAAENDAVDTSVQIFSEIIVKTFPLYISVQSHSKKRINRHLYPLVRQVSKLVAENLTDTLCDTYGLFNTGDEFNIENRQTELKTILTTTYGTLDLEDGYSIIVDQLIKSMVNDGAFRRFAKHLRTMSYAKRPLDTVNFERNYEDTLIFIGSKGWKELATEKNVMEVLNLLTVEITFKNKTLARPLH